MLNSIITEIMVSIIATLIIAAVMYIYRRAITIKVQSWLLRQKGIGITNVYLHRTNARAAISKAWQSAQVIRYIGIQGLDIITHREVMFSDLAKSMKFSNRKTQSAKFLILDPDSGYVKIRAQEVEQQPQEIERGIKHSLEDLYALNDNINTANLEIRLYNCLPIWNLLFLDDVLFLSFYLNGIRGPQSICFETNRNSAIFHAFEKYFDYVWDSAKPALSQEITNE